ncbi:MAG TPA: CRTAC1 family protein [Candidatus Angelobacter sp.]|nr:CRTAC1 family protein [Candidatus Angelobacter sp.]
MNIKSVTLLLLLIAFNAGDHSAIHFEEMAARAGIHVQHHSRRFPGEKGEVLRMFALFGSAVAVADYDGDGYEDIFVVDSGEGTKNHLYHNNGNMTFTDVTSTAGVGGGNDENGFVTDALWFDYDNDGKPDLLLARFGTPILYHNEGGGIFKDVTAQSGLNRFANSAAVIAFDYDNDGKLDLLFGNYFKPVNLLHLKDTHVLPNSMVNATNGGGVSLWRNLGNGVFEDVTEKANLGGIKEWIFDVGHGDLNNDGLQDIYLASDYGPDHLFLNNGNGTFREATARAIGWDNKNGMNVEVADYDNDGWMDVYVTNITNRYAKQCNMLWHNNRDGTFTDVSRETETCEAGWAWAAKFGDFDNDGWQDLIVANGLHSAGREEYVPALSLLSTLDGADLADYTRWPDVGDKSWNGHEKKRLFRNLGNGSFAEVGASAGVANDFDGRGIALADFDNDGRIDFVQSNVDQELLFFHNTSQPAGNWLEVRLIGTKSNRDAIGARVTLRAGNLTQIREVNGGNGFESQSSRTLHFGLGEAKKIDRLEILWPSGIKQVASVSINRLVTIEEAWNRK